MMRCHCTAGYMCNACVEWGDAHVPVSRLPQRLKRYRSRRGLTQTQLAHSLSCSKRTVYNLESGRTRCPQRWLLAALSRILGIVIPPPS